jgi:DNA-binding transcriptional ArsR family regulator
MDRNAYYQLPKFLFEGELEHLSNDARVLYALLRDRHDLLLSIKNDLAGANASAGASEDGGVYLSFSREHMCEIMKLSRPTITKAMNDLKKHGLIEERRPGMGQTNRIYLLPTIADQTEEPPPEAVDEAYWETFFLS